MKRLIVIAAALMMAGCVTTGPVITDKAQCSKFIPEAMKDDVEGVDLGATPARPVDAERNTEGFTQYLENVADYWRNAFVGQTGQKKKESEEKQAILHIQAKCEENDAAAIERARPKFLGVF